MSRKVDKFLRWAGNSDQTDNNSQNMVNDWKKPKEDYVPNDEYAAFINSPELLERLFTSEMESKKDKEKFNYRYRYDYNQVDKAYAVYKKMIRIRAGV